MRIGELAERVGTTARALRYYEQRGLLTAGRDPNGYRDYPPSAVQRIRQVRALLDAGFTSDNIRVILPCVEGEVPTVQLCPDVAREMQTVLASIDSKVTALQHHRTLISALLRTARPEHAAAGSAGHLAEAIAAEL